MSANAQCGYGTSCPDCCAYLGTDKDSYQVGEEVTLIFSNPSNFDFVIERVYIQRQYSRSWLFSKGDVVYSYEFPETVIPSVEWTWKWDQKDNYSKS